MDYLLPRDSWMDILKFVDRGDYSSLSMVCKNFYNLIASNRTMNYHRLFHNNQNYFIENMINDLCHKNGHCKIYNKNLIHSIIIWSLNHPLKVALIVRTETYFIYLRVIKKLESMLGKKLFLQPHPKYNREDNALVSKEGFDVALKNRKGILITKSQAYNKTMRSSRDKKSITIIKDDSFPNAQCSMVVMWSYITTDLSRTIMIRCCREKCAPINSKICEI